MPQIYKLTYAKKYLENFMLNHLSSFREWLKNLIYQSMSYLDINIHTLQIYIYMQGIYVYALKIYSHILSVFKYVCMCECVCIFIEWMSWVSSYTLD